MNIESFMWATCLGMTLCCTIVAIGCLVALTRVWVKLEAFEKSTHQIQYVPIEENEESLTGDKLEENIRKAMGEEQIEREYL